MGQNRRSREGAGSPQERGSDFAQSVARPGAATARAAAPPAGDHRPPRPAAGGPAAGDGGRPRTASAQCQCP